MRFAYYCGKASKVGKVTTKYTHCNAANDQKIQFLDRQNVQCGSDGALVSWYFARHGCGGGNMRYKYTCAKVPITSTYTRKSG
jgi:hypothetical protein